MAIHDFSVNGEQNVIIWHHKGEDSEMSLKPKIDLEGTSLGVLATEQEHISDLLLFTAL